MKKDYLHLVHVCQIIAQTSLAELNLKQRLEEKSEFTDLEIKAAYDAEDQSILRFSISQEKTTFENIKSVITFITDVVKEVKVSWPGLSVSEPDLTKPIPKREKVEAKDGLKAICVNADPLPGNEIGPVLELGKSYPVNGLTLDSKENQHLDVGLVSTLSYVRSYETGEQLKDGNKIHWCHPSRFILESE
jgi:ethanolamine utilization protein EutA (predicted chaperonin)